MWRSASSRTVTLAAVMRIVPCVTTTLPSNVLVLVRVVGREAVGAHDDLLLAVGLLGERGGGGERAVRQARIAASGAHQRGGL